MKLLLKILLLNTSWATAPELKELAFPEPKVVDASKEEKYSQIHAWLGDGGSRRGSFPYERGAVAAHRAGCEPLRWLSTVARAAKSGLRQQHLDQLTLLRTWAKKL